MHERASSEDVRSPLARIFPATPHTTYTPPIYTHTSNLLFARHQSICAGESSSSSFPPPPYSHTRIHCPAAPPISLFSSSLLLCVFCFGAVIFRLISEVMHFLQIKEEAGAAHPPPPAPRTILLPPPQLPSPTSLLPTTTAALPPQSPVLAPLGPPGQRGDKGAPIISLLVLIWAAQGFQVPPITPRNIITSSPGNTAPHTHTDTGMHTLSDADARRLQWIVRAQ